MNISIAFTLSVVISIVSAAFNGAMYGVLAFIITLPVLLFISSNLAYQNKQRNSSRLELPDSLRSSSSSKLFTWPTLSRFQFEVDGEPQYQPILEKLAAQLKKHTNHSETMPALKAHLVPDDMHKLVQVKIEDKTVGYFNISDTRSFRRRLSAKKLTGQTTVCNALIGGGEYEDGQRHYYNVMLDLKPFS